MSVRFDRFGDIIVYQHHEYSIAKHGVKTEKKIINSHNTSNTVKKPETKKQGDKKCDKVKQSNKKKEKKINE